jgi:hypothetical protein
MVDYYYILNTTISDNSDWLITATSYLYDYEIECLNDDLVQGDLLNISIQIPEASGIILFELCNSQGATIHTETKILNSSTTNFNYKIPSDLPNGLYYIYVFWQNNLNAGVQSHAIYVSTNNENQATALWLVSIISITTIILLGSISAYAILKIKRGRADKVFDISKNEEIQSRNFYEKIIHNRFRDIFNLKTIVISEKYSSLYIFEKNFQGNAFDPLLISGFMEAIKSFGNELIDIATFNQILNIEYQGLNIYMVELNFFNFILIMSGKPSNEFLLSIDNLVEEIDYRYGYKIENFNGDIYEFKGIINIIEKYIDVNMLDSFQFNANLNYPFNPDEKDFLYIVYDIMKQSGKNHFYLSSILSKTGFALKAEEIILKFIKRKIFIPFKS